MSPVLESFLAGQQGQAQLLGLAQNILNQKAERQQKQQEIDNMMKRFDVSSKQEQARVENEHDRIVQEHQAQMFNVRQKVLEGLQSGAIPQQGTSSPGLDPTTVQQNRPNPALLIPGVSPTQVPATVPTTSNIQGVAPQFTPNSTQNVDIGGGQSISVPTPKTNNQLALEQQQALFPGEVKKAVDIFKGTKEPILQSQINYKDMQLAQKEQLMEQQKELANNRLEQTRQLAELGIASREQLAEMRVQHEMAGRYGYRTPEQYKQDIQANASGVADGRLTLEQIANPQEKIDTREALSAMQLGIPDKGVISDVMSRATKAARFLTIAPRLKELANNNSTTDQIASAIRNHNPFSSVKGEFDSLLQPLLPDLESAQGLSLARAGSSTNMLKAQKVIPPSLTDLNPVIDTKIGNSADLILSAIASRISNLTTGHQQRIWKRIVTENPEILNNPIVGPKVANAKATGLYKVGQ